LHRTVVGAQDLGRARAQADHIYKMGDRETLCWNAEAAVLLEDSRRPESLDAA
jgi:hypothetical protein